MKMSCSDEVESIEFDRDSCTTTELFNESLRIASEEAISLENDFILYLDSSRNFDRLAAVTSSRKVFLFDLNRSKGYTQLHRSHGSSFDSKEENKICGIRFANGDSNTIYVAEANGNVFLYDIRSVPTHVQTFNKDSELRETYTCFDVNANDTMLCAGTDRTKEEAHLILLDIRKCSTFATFSDCHSQDLTQVKFHPKTKNVLASGSTDGLINIYNTIDSNEDDALEFCINTERSVQTINWHMKNAESSLMTCITDTNDFQLIDVEESEIIFQAERDAIVKEMKRTNVEECYLANCHSAMNDDIFLLGGSHGNAGECLRSLTLCDKTLQPRNNFAENKQIVRCSIFNPKENILVTAGEGGIVTVWENFHTSNVDSHKLKEKVNPKANRKSKPY